MIKDGVFVLPSPGDVYKDHHGQIVTISTATYNQITFYRSGGVLCTLPGALFKRRFEFVKTGHNPAPVNLDHPLIARLNALRNMSRPRC